MHIDEQSTTPPGVSLCDTPWQAPDGGADRTVTGRPTLVTPHDILRVHAAGCRDVLPFLDGWADAAGRWKRFELPTAAEQNLASMPGKLELSLEASNGTRYELSVHVIDELRRLPPSAVSEDEDVELNEPAVGSVSAVETQSAAVEELIDRHMSFVSDLQHRSMADDRTWNGGVHHGILRPLIVALDRWTASGDRSEPRMALIVRLAETLPHLTADLCGRPRRVLSRVREIVPASRVQQLDGGCLRWLARRPGRTVAEKAGSKQMILGVTRRESTDTPENRVLRDFLVRGTRACGRYVREHRHALNHGRVLRVMRFRRILRLALKGSAVANVRPLTGVAQPNYVLQHDARYRPMWEAYVQLVRQEAEQDRVWRWRHRLWAEHCRLGLLNALRENASLGPALSSDAFFHSEQDAGQYFRSQTGAAAWRLKKVPAGEAVDVVHGSDVAEHPLVPQFVRKLAPDTILVRRRDNRVVHVGLAFSQLKFSGHRTSLDSLSVLIAEASNLPSCTAVYFTPAMKDFDVFTNGPVRQIELPVPAQNASASFADAVNWLTSVRQ